MEILDALMQFPWVRQRSNIFMRAKILVVFVRNHGDVVAICALSHLFNVPALFVREEFRGRGIAGRIYKRTVQEGRKQGLHYLISSVYVNNIPAMRMHRRLGFKKTLDFEKLGYIIVMLPLSLWGETLHQFLSISGKMLPKPFLIGASKLVEKIL